MIHLLYENRSQVDGLSNWNTYGKHRQITYLIGACNCQLLCEYFKNACVFPVSCNELNPPTVFLKAMKQPSSGICQAPKYFLLLHQYRINLI